MDKKENAPLNGAGLFSYNLVDEKWIALLKKNGLSEKEGLRNVFLRPGDYVDVYGEARLQDAAILRMLIAISVTLLYRYDENGNQSPPGDCGEALRRFKKVWDNGGYSRKAVNDYFDRWHDRFDLFDPERPFYQIPLNGLRWTEEKKKQNMPPRGIKPVLGSGVMMNWLPMAAIDPRVLRTANRPLAPFKDISEESANSAPVDEAARMMLFYNAFADCTVGKAQYYIRDGKRTTANAGMTFPSRGALVTPVGNDLFETLMLGSVLFSPERHEMFDPPRPSWEDGPGTDLPVSMTVPNDLARMYTQQARRMSLYRDGSAVKGIFASAGETYSGDLLWMEPAFMTQEIKSKKDGQTIVAARHRRSGVDIWQEIEYIAGGHGSGIVKWVNVLQANGVFGPERVIPFRVTDIAYGTSNCGYQDMTVDRVLINSRLLSDTVTCEKAIDEISVIKKVAAALSSYAEKCAACMRRPAAREKQDLISTYFSEVGKAFLKYLDGSLTYDQMHVESTAAAKRTVDGYEKLNGNFLIGSAWNGVTHGAAYNKVMADIYKIERG